MKHTVEWCKVCDCYAVVCGDCGNKCCNGGTVGDCGCADAYAIQSLIGRAIAIWAVNDSFRFAGVISDLARHRDSR